jgi:hypothetical protein
MTLVHRSGIAQSWLPVRVSTTEGQSPASHRQPSFGVAMPRGDSLRPMIMIATAYGPVRLFMPPSQGIDEQCPPISPCDTGKGENINAHDTLSLSGVETVWFLGPPVQNIGQA